MANAHCPMDVADQDSLVLALLATFSVATQAHRCISSHKGPRSLYNLNHSELQLYTLFCVIDSNGYNHSYNALELLLSTDSRGALEPFHSYTYLIYTYLNAARWSSLVGPLGTFRVSA